jgi:hypothetical protein
MNLRVIFVFCAFAFCMKGASAEECLKYKMIPSLKIKEPSHLVSVVRSAEPIDLFHGTTISNFVEDFEIDYGAMPKGEGWCVYVEKISAVIGYSDFVIEIDGRHEMDSCEWRGILDHEEEHVDAHLAALVSNRNWIRRSVAAAAASLLPVYAENDGLDDAMDRLGEDFRLRPHILLIESKLSAERAVRDRKIDFLDRGARLKKCMEF